MKIWKLIFITIPVILVINLFNSCQKYGKLMKVETGSVENIMATGAEVDAMIIDIGESGLTEHGWCISTSQNPSINDKKVNNGSKNNYGNYSNMLTGLDPSTKYYIRSYISGNGTIVYGEQIELTTNDLSFGIDFPINGAILGTGQNYDIKWTANFNDRIKIELYKGGTLIKTIAKDLENNGTYSWMPSIELSNADDYMLVIISVENEEVKAETAVFSIYDNAPATVISEEISNIDYFSARADASIENFGTENSVNQHGHCWSTNENPTIADNKTELGSKNTIGNFTSELSNLQDNTTYYIRAYSTNNTGTAYSEQKSFMTLDAVPPSVSTTSITDIGYTNATCGGEVTNTGTHSIIERGVCWSTTENPLISDDKSIDGSGTGTFISNITSLANNTNYYVRAYATNVVGTAYGMQQTFATLELVGGEISDYDGNIYQTIAIGNQVWMAENLKSLKYSDGTPVSNAYTYSTIANYVEEYGRLYLWSDVMKNSTIEKAQGICPPGWHVPSDDEFQTLIDFLGGESVAGGKMKEAGLEHWSSPNTGANNLSGFKALPAGLYNPPVLNFGTAGYFWSSTETGTYTVPVRGVYHDSEGVTRGEAYKGDGHSIRCIKDVN